MTKKHGQKGEQKTMALERTLGETQKKLQELSRRLQDQAITISTQTAAIDRLEESNKKLHAELARISSLCYNSNFDATDQNNNNFPNQDTQEKTLVFYGIAEESEGDQLCQAVESILSQKMGISPTTPPYTKIDRIGQNKNPPDHRPRPVKVTFGSATLRNSAWYARWKLKGSTLAVSEVMSREDRIQRAIWLHKPQIKEHDISQNPDNTSDVSNPGSDTSKTTHSSRVSGRLESFSSNWKDLNHIFY